jgi:hypothetical protein
VIGWLVKRLCTLAGHRRPLDVELGQRFGFTVFRCRSCGVKWMIAWED